MVARKCRSVLSSSDHLPMTLSTSQNFEVNPTTQNVPLRSGPPTKEELQVHYPAKFSWTQLKTFVNSGLVFVVNILLLLSFLTENVVTLGFLNVIKSFRPDIMYGLRVLSKSMAQWVGIQLL